MIFPQGQPIFMLPTTGLQYTCQCTLHSPMCYTPPGMPSLGKEPSLTQPSPASISMSTTPAPEPEEPTVDAPSRPSAKAKYRGPRASKLEVSADLKDDLCKYIYDFLVWKELTDQEGYLIADVFSEVWQDMGDGADGRRKAECHFGSLLRSAPQYFRVFRKDMPIATITSRGWLARKGEKMVSLVLQK